MFFKTKLLSNTIECRLDLLQFSTGVYRDVKNSVLL